MNKRFQAIILAIFFASGCSSLIYQVAWQRILTLYYSVENISTTFIVTVYMLGLGLGAIIGGKLSERIKDKITFYFVIELLIGIFGCISISFLEFLGKSTSGVNYLLSFFCMFAFLCVPTILMGMTLPLLVKIFNSFANNFLKTISSLYFINTLGAAAGAMISCYVLITFWGLDISIYIAAAINFLIAFTVIINRSKIPIAEQAVLNEQATVTVEASQNPNSSIPIKIVYWIVFLTGFIAIGYEILWFRIIGTLVKASPYAFASVLFIYLLGIALGSYYMQKRLLNPRKKQVGDRRQLFFKLQLYIAAYVVLSIVIYFQLLKHVHIFEVLNSVAFAQDIHPKFAAPNFSSGIAFYTWFMTLTDIFIYPIYFVLVPTLLMGASFPLVTSLAYGNTRDEGDTVGRVYFFNVLGNVAGGLLTGLLFLDIFGTEITLLILSAAGMVFILFIKPDAMKTAYKVAYIGCFVAIAIFLFPERKEFYDIIHPRQKEAGGKKIIREGIDGIFVTYASDKKIMTYIGGMAHGGRPSPHFYYEAMMTMSLNKNLKDVLVIGFGTGSTMEVLLKLDKVPKMTLVELSTSIIDNSKDVPVMRDFLVNDYVDIVYNDGRKFLYNTNKKYDAIFMDPLRTTTSFSNNLYSKQFFDLVKDHLTDEGVAMIWTDETHVMPKTVATSFPYVRLYTYFMVASKSPLRTDDAYRSSLLGLLPEHETTLRNIDTAYSSYKDQDAILRENSQYPINTDYKPVCEYYLGLARYK